MRAIALSAILFSPLSFALDTESPYAGEEGRQIKALSSSEIEGYENGGGLGYAKAAELNHYPGPKHVLELATELGLSEAQLAQTEQLFHAMKQQATALGIELVKREAALDEAFAAGSMNSERLNEMVAEIASLEGQIRFVHLDAHLEQKSLLSEHQAMKYDVLRGYADHSGGHQH